jgi:hypothetical protein
MAKQHLYSVFKINPNHWHVVKYDKVLKIEEDMYEVSRTGRGEWLCECAAANKETCRHRQLVHIFTQAHRIGSGKMYDFDKATWVEN